MKKYAVTLEHDNGKIVIITNATTPEQAIKQVLDAENAPVSAVKKVNEI